ncbi:MAG: hypothetical protein ACLTBV_27235 [Enterocloster bolteae]
MRRYFKETIRINTLDYDKYQKIQQRIIEALDQAGLCAHNRPGR